MKIIIEINKKKIIKEEKASFIDPETGLTKFEGAALVFDKEMVNLLNQVVDQLKVLNLHTTPAKSIGASGTELAVARHRVAERIMHHLQEIRKNK